MQKLKKRPLYGAVDIYNDILWDHGVCLSYKRVWMGKEVVRAAIHGSEVSSYDLLLQDADKVVKMNPSSVVTIDDEEYPFKLAFFSFQAYLFGFKQKCKLLLFVDKTHLLGKYSGILLGAIGKVGNEGLFHVAFTIVNNKIDKNQTQFLATLGKGLYSQDDYDKIITFISDRSKVLVNTIM